MAERKQCEFFLVRYVPDAVRDEFVNIGVVLLANGEGSAEVRFTRDWRRVRCLDADADIEMLQAMEAEIRERLQQGGADRERILHLLRDSFSNTVQISATKACLTESPAEEAARLAEIYLGARRVPAARETRGRRLILAKMKDAFEQAGVWKLFHHDVAVAPYTRAGDPLKLDCGYRPNGVIKFFHAVPLATEVEAAKVLAFSYPQVREGMARLEHVQTELTAIVEGDLDRGDEAVAFALEVLERSQIAVAGTGELARLAEVARRELRV